MTDDLRRKTPLNSPKWYRKRHRNLFERSWQENHSKNSKDSKAGGKNLSKSNAFKKVRRKSFETKATPKEPVQRTHTSKMLRIRD
jgi:hypothetical protein